jgi:hypothetical protein
MTVKKSIKGSCTTSTAMDTTHPGYEEFTIHFSTLISTMPPPFMYMNNADAIQTTIAVIDNVLNHLSSAHPQRSATHAQMPSPVSPRGFSTNQ